MTLSEQPIVRTCDRCNHLVHGQEECDQVVGYDHLNGNHECGCPGPLTDQEKLNEHWRSGQGVAFPINPVPRGGVQFTPPAPVTEPEHVLTVIAGEVNDYSTAPGGELAGSYVWDISTQYAITHPEACRTGALCPINWEVDNVGLPDALNLDRYPLAVGRYSLEYWSHHTTGPDDDWDSGITITRLP